MPLPAHFLARMERLLGSDFPAFLACYNEPPRSGLRVNTLKVTQEDFLGFSPFSLQPLLWTDMGFEIQSKSPSAGKHPYHAAGLYYLQEPSAMAVAEALAPQPGEKVLDLAAAPGGKTTHLAAKMQGQGLLIANEIHPRRVWDLAENLERWGVPHAVVTNEAPGHLADHFGAYFDRVLVDAPCSGEGLFRKNPSAQREWTEALVRSCAVRQSAILRQAARLVRPGGWLVYSTCTFAPEENETVIAQFLKDNHTQDTPHFELISLSHIPGLGSSRPEWIKPSLAVDVHQTQNAARIWPHHSQGEGHFIALLQRLDTVKASPLLWDNPKRVPSSTALEQARSVYFDFCKNTLLPEPVREGIELVGSYLYRAPIPLLALRGLNLIHPGLWLGTIKKNRFEPSHALAMTLQVEQAQRIICLDPSDPAYTSYLQGEPLPGTLTDGEGNGWSLVSLTTPEKSHRFPLGWGRLVGDQVKNAYPKGLRHTG